MKTAVIYARYSSDSQSEQSIDGQLRVCEEYARNNDILILDTYIDRAMTGTNDNRPDFQRMIKNSYRKEWTYVLVYKLDRFSRNKYETAIHKKTLRDNGTKVLSAMENIPDTPEGIILESLLEGMNQYYSAELAQKVRRGMNESRTKGNYQGGGLPYGYKVVNKKILIDEETAPVVNYIYEQYSIGVYVRDIISTLTRKGIYHKGKPFAMNTVYGILANEKYSGIYRHGEEIFTNMYPPIVPTEIYQKVRAIVEKNKCGKRSVKVNYLFRHKMVCGYCGEPISAETGTARNGEVIRYYKCLGRKKHKNDCKKSMVKKEDLEKVIIDNILQELSKPHIMDKIVKGILAMQDYQLKLNSSLNALIRAKTNTQNALNNLMNAIEQGIISNTTNKRLHELEKQLEDLERQILIERSKLTIKYTANEVEEFYKQMLILSPEMLVNYAIKQIVLYDDKIVIKLNNPTKRSPDDSDNTNSQGFCFTQLSIKLQGVKMQMLMYV